MTMRAYRSFYILIMSLILTACSVNHYLSQDTASTGRLSDETVLLHASSGRLAVAHARIITGNDDAFRSKLEMIQSAKTSIDAMYYIYAEDFSSSVLTQALLEAARRGVRVRLLVDYQTNYKNLDLFSMMEEQGNTGRGTLEVRLYNRPSRAIVEDAVYLTMGCGEVQQKGGETCATAKFADIDARFQGERIGTRAAAEVGASNLDIGNSGLFLSGLYAKEPDIMAFSVLEGQNIDLDQLKKQGGTPSEQERKKLKKLGQLYLHSKISAPFKRLSAKILLATVFEVHGKTLTPLYDTLTGYLPVERKGNKEAARDWEYLTDYLHHKFLLVDRAHVQLGGRNIEDSYHMLPNPMTKKYVFMDTDLRVDLTGGDERLQAAFEALWNFQSMVARVSEVRQHAPNDFAANHDIFREAEKECTEKQPQSAQEACILQVFTTRALPLEARVKQRYAEMVANAARYWKEYPYADTPDPSPSFEVDSGAFLAYVENLPFYGEPGAPPLVRSYGAVNGQEARYGKRIHSLWLLGLTNACRTATAAAPQRVILHSAYFAPPSNLLRMLARMTNGDLDCRHVTITVLTNSIATTDLSVVNLLAQQSLKAFQEYYASKRNAETSPRVEYYEYQQGEGIQHRSLHTKLSIFAEDMIVGSANSDVRSYMMDSNNGMILRKAPALMTAYIAYIDGLLRDTSKVANLTTSFAGLSHDQIVQEDLKALEALIDKYGVRKHLDHAQIKSAEDEFVQIVNEAYVLSKQILAGGWRGCSAQAKFNRMFKPI